jgi:iron complex transport system substrate-binding protein
MKKLLALLLVLATVSVLAAHPIAAQTDGNLTDECVTDYDPDTDYFPDKVEVSAAENFIVEYFNHYKVVTVSDAFNAAEPFTYVLVQCGTPAPDADDFPADTQFVEVPTDDIIAMSTTILPHLTALGLVDNLVGLDSFLFVNSPEVRERIDNGELVEIGSGTEVNVEVALDTEPDVILTYGFNPASDAHPVLIDAGIFTALSADYRESTPLGRAEWIKFTALFFNQEAAAEAAFADIVTAYNAASELAASVDESDRPTVLWNAFSSFSDAWSIPGAETYAGALIQDAGGEIALGEEAPEESAMLSFEVVYAGALEADVWLVNTFGVRTIDDLLAIDSRYADFAAVQEGDVWNNDLDVNENGGYNYFELGVTNPHLILQDLVAIFYPELLPEHEFNFFQPLDE